MDTEHLMQKIAQVAPGTYNFIMSTAPEVRESPFRDEIVGELSGLVKKAMNPMWGTAGRAVAGVGAVAATGVALSLAGDMYDALKRGITKGRDYRNMMKENPDLAEMQGPHVQKAFATLHHFNPEFAGDPTVAGSFVRHQAALGEFDPKQLTEFIGARQALTNIKKIQPPGHVPWESGREHEMGGLNLEHLRRKPFP